ncbi:dipeptide/oligopeptide/nickel ABC transporter permease/ATP-binding protein [Sinomonas sp. ASV486]|uniref:dipeptide/oligopeptide/nickel ABC transporter permease/ATP-binding protein n=1 Tax=Sinomonas sp. ASV486 TaxID=3051170 RepID=UPI0027DCAE14|nr:dipeptide/oligopeptide/nickel ABC transporter permease/ATP-binding protein [Sinomonas sp. ASV486]MDQ4488977.1 dipeptide/oligopeptide/nickel ABC transporter permease/ATP-binding protein [Sinomonas sp. ASV486]
MTIATSTENSAGPAAAGGPTGLVRRILRSPVGLACLIYLAIVVIACAFAPWIAPYDPLAQDLHAIGQGPSGVHLLGTDVLGRDVLSRLLFGGSYSLGGVLIAVVVLLVVAVPIGLLAGYAGGRADRIISRVIDVAMSVPVIIILLAVLTIFNRNMTAAMTVFGLLGSSGLIRVIRGNVMSVREELYIDAARVIGLGPAQIAVRHVLPRTAGAIIVHVSIFAAISLGVQTGLSYLGLGVPPPAPTWGGMVGDAATVIQTVPWLLVPSGGIIALTVLAFGLLGDVVRDATSERAKTATAGKSKRKAATAVDSRLAAPGSLVPHSEALLSVRGLTVAFGPDDRPITVVENVSFDVLPGECVGLVGESGSGKTVTALSLLGLLKRGGRITAGSVLLEGRDISGLPEREKRRFRGTEIALISQEPMVALDPSFTIGDQLAEVVRSHTRMKNKKVSRAAARKRAVELITAVNIPDPEAVAKRYPHQISGGQAQRVAIAAAIAGDPKLLIADEPTTALDVTVQAEILDLLRSLQSKNGMAVLIVTHDWGVVADLCDRALVMYAGQIVETADIGRVFDHPLHPYTKALLEASPHLAVEGEPLPAIPGSVPRPTDWPKGCHFAARCRFATDACVAAPIPLLDMAHDRTSRCIHTDQLMPEDRRVPEAVR